MNTLCQHDAIDMALHVRTIKPETRFLDIPGQLPVNTKLGFEKIATASFAQALRAGVMFPFFGFDSSGILTTIMDPDMSFSFLFKRTKSPPKSYPCHISSGTVRLDPWDIHNPKNCMVLSTFPPSGYMSYTDISTTKPDYLHI